MTPGLGAQKQEGPHVLYILQNNDYFLVFGHLQPCGMIATNVGLIPPEDVIYHIGPIPSPEEMAMKLTN